jgi:MYXO-CTERM domain-containing protein
MNSIRRAAVAALPAVLLALAGATASADVQSDARADQQALDALVDVPYRDLCGAAAPGMMRCHAKVVTDIAGQAIVAANPSGLSPASIQAAYKLPTTGGNGKIVAIIDAYDATNAERDLGTYRTQFGLPACTTANGCFQKVNQRGVAGSYPKADSGWAGEIALDVDMVSAACPDCKILLIEADSPSTDDLGASVNMAAKMGAAAISNSYGGPEDNTVSAVSAQYYKHPGIAVTVSSGDSGYGVEFPASSEFVISVGGTALTKSTSTRGWTEAAWTSGGSGCSAYIAKPSWQTNTQCAKRLVADVSAVGDPRTGPAVYDGGWQVVGGTSASAPLVAAMLVLLGQSTADASFLYAHASSFFDVTTGKNGTCGNLMCTAGTGYDGPTGIGTFNGTALAGTTPTPPPVTQDAGPPAAVDAGTTPVDAGTTPPADSGTTPPATPDAGGAPVDSGTVTPPPLGGSDASTTPPGTIPGGGNGTVDAGKGTGTTPSNPDDGFAAPAQASGCGCAVPGTSTPVGGSASAALALGAIALVVSRRRRR